MGLRILQFGGEFFLRIGDSNYYVWGLVFLRLGVKDSYVERLFLLRLGLIIITFGG